MRHDQVKTLFFFMQGEVSPIMLIWSSTVSGLEGTLATGMTLFAGENRSMFVKRVQKRKIIRVKHEA